MVDFVQSLVGICWNRMFELCNLHNLSALSFFQDVESIYAFKTHFKQ